MEQLAVETQTPRRWSCTAWPLIILTLLAAAIRFTALNRPPLLIDECFTFWRTCGSYADLVNTLRDDGFVPLHYELLWWIKEGFPLTPHFHLIPGGLYLTPYVMRFFPAVCGTLMVPAIYFTARQLLSKFAAFLSAIFIATSAYALFFSRDSKMYAPTWLLVTLSMGCLMWWLRTAKTTAWLTWIASAAAAAGFHVVTLLLLALAPIFFITSRRATWKQAILLLLGICFIAAGPAGYYLTFNRWTEKSGGIVPGAAGEPAPDANWEASGLGWLGSNDSGVKEAFRSLNTYLTSYEWDGDTNPFDWSRSPTWLRPVVIWTTSAILFFVIVGMLPWPQRWRAKNCDATEPWWRAALWLSAWIVLPAYGFFYCRSYDPPASPLDWLDLLQFAITRFWIWITPGLVLISLLALYPWRKELILSTVRRRLIQLVQLVLIIAVILSICQGAQIAWVHVRAVALAKHPELEWQTIWHTRYIGFVMPAVWIAVAALVARLPTRPMRWIAISIIVAANLANAGARVIAHSQVPYDRAFADIWKSQPGADVRTYFDLGNQIFGGIGWPTGVYWRPMAAYYACVVARIPTSPPDFRTGKIWPFRYGPVMDRFKEKIVYRPYIGARGIAEDIGASPELRHIIIWQGSEGVSPQESGLAEKLGPSWKVVDDQVITHWWNWTWIPRGDCRRTELLRIK